MWHEPFVAVACSAVAGEARRDLAGREGGWELSAQAPTVCQVWMHSYRTQDPASTPVPAETNIVPRKLLTEIRQWNFSALHHIFTDQMLTRPSAEDLLSFFLLLHLFSFSFFYLCTVFFLPQCKAWTASAENGEIFAVPSAPGKPGWSQEHWHNPSPPGDEHHQRADEAEPRHCKPKHQKEMLLSCSFFFFCISCPCLFSNKNNRSVSANFLSSQRKWELWLFLTLHRWQFLVKVLQTGRDEENARC